jgi:hypothetical protein
MTALRIRVPSIYITGGEVAFEYCFAFLGFFAITIDDFTGEKTVGWVM